ncbi:MAG: hypothetical protein HYW26_00145 [Candidatus Aenigmarchaeota archaeon]|nr:hypothetical protein [Candidatus Aenigmarchaeota archaeon]
MPYEVEGMSEHPTKRAIEFVLFLIIVSAALTLWFNAEAQKQENAPVFPATGNDEINRILATKNNNLGKNMNEIWMSNCRVPKERSLVNLVHISKKSGGYEISCEFGPSYDYVSYNVGGSTPSVYAGWIADRKCDGEIAAEIDKAVREVNSCPVLLREKIPDDLADYYVVSLYCRSNFKKEYVISTRDIPKCVEPLLSGNVVIPISYDSVVDVRTGRAWI